MKSRKNELKETINNKILFGDLDSTRLIEFYIIDNDFYTKYYEIDKSGDIIRHHSLSDNYSKAKSVHYNFKKKDNKDKNILSEVWISFNSYNDITIKSIQIINTKLENTDKMDKVQTQTTEMKDEIKIKSGESVVGQIIFAGSTVPPIVRMIKTQDYVDDFLNLESLYISTELYKESDFLFNSLDSNIESETKEYINSTIDSFSGKTANPKQMIESIYTSSSLSKEEVEYDDNGEVIKYNNPINNIRMKRTVDEKGGIETFVYYKDTIISYDYKIINENGNETIKIYHPLIFNQSNVKFEFDSSISEKMCKIEKDGDPNTNEYKILDKDGNQIGTNTFTMNKFGLLIAQNLYFGDDISLTYSDNYCIFRSKSDIKYTINIGDVIDYIDNDCSFKVSISVPYKLYSYNSFFKSKDKIYIRDMFGIPELYKDYIKKVE